MVNRKTTQDQIYTELRQILANGTFRQGERIQEDRLARQFNVSRTPLREALSKLVQDGLLVSVPYRGVFVRTYSVSEVQQLFEIRAQLESFAAQSACLRASDDELAEIRNCLGETERIIQDDQGLNEIIRANTRFHMAIAAAAHNTWLVSMLESLHAHFGLLRGTNLTNPTRRREVLTEHRALLGALLARDAAEAERLAKAHMADAWTFARETQVPEENSIAGDLIESPATPA
jgi:DNA-binding GntR family transcriptional regulator